MPTHLPKPKAVAGIPARRLQGQFYRLIADHLRDQVLSTEGSQRYGGRYNPKERFGAIYCSEQPAICRAEVQAAAAGRTLSSFVLASVKVRLNRVLDLTDRAVLHRLGLRPTDLVAPDWGLTQELSRLAHEAGFEALLVPSAAAPGTNLVLFLDNLDPASSIELLAVDRTEM